MIPEAEMLKRFIDYDDYNYCIIVIRAMTSSANGWAESFSVLVGSYDYCLDGEWNAALASSTLNNTARQTSSYIV